MGAALQLARAEQLPPAPKRKRKDGDGGGDGKAFYEYATRIYADDRADAQTRELLLAVAYAVVTCQPDDGHAQWELVRQALGVRKRGAYGLDRLIEHDVPRYVSPEYLPGGWDNMKRLCMAPRLRLFRSRPWKGATPDQIAAQARKDDEDFRNVEKICGNTAQDYVVEKLPGTGWHKLHYFCPAHRDHLLRVRAQVAGGNKLAPAPIPNAGGLLPSYFDADWLTMYRRRRGEQWEPPVYGIRADDWPIPGKEIVPLRARLRLAAVDGELITT